MDFPLQSQAILGFLALLLFYNLWTVRSRAHRSKTKGAPEPAGSWPIVGHLLTLVSRRPLAQTLGALADKYGPAIALRIGVHRVLVISSWELAKECFTINDKAFASRAKNGFFDHFSYDYAVFSTSPYGPYWREIRKIITVELLSTQRLELLQHIWATEIDVLVAELHGLWVKNHQNPVKVEMTQRLLDFTFNVVSMMMVGKRFSGGSDEVGQFRQAFHRCYLSGGLFVLSDPLPFLKWIDLLDLKGRMRARKSGFEELDSLVTKWLEDHRQKRQSGQDKHGRDFLDVMISVMENADIPSYDPDTVIKATIMTPFLAGDETTSITITWAISLLVNHPNVLRKAQEEVDAHIGMDRNVKSSDINNLAYLQAIVKETLRLYPSAPLSLPHLATEDCSVGGFHVPAGTRLTVNLWKIQRDPRVWLDPSKFQPERFLMSHADVDVKGQHFEYIPFGSGRRMCPGASLALRVVHLTLARLIHGFEMRSHQDGPIDMTESASGPTMARATPLEIMFTPRLSSKLYQASS